MSSVYIVAEIGWEYNDEYMYRPDSEGVMPSRAFSTIEKAVEACNKANAKRYLEEASSFYMWLNYNAFDRETLQEMFDENPPGKPGDISEWDEKDIIKAFQLNETPFFEVIELEMEE